MKLLIEVYRKLLLEEILEQGKTDFGFFEFFKKFIEEAKIKTNLKTGKIISSNTIKNYNNTYNHLKEFSRVKKKRIDFDTIDLDFYHDFN
jgi:hypothetical protein